MGGVGRNFGMGGVGQNTSMRQKNGMGLNILLFNHTLQNTLCLLRMSFI